MAASAERSNAQNPQRRSRPPPSSGTSHCRMPSSSFSSSGTKDPGRYGHGALRWHARFCREVPGVTLAEAAAVLALLAALADSADRGAPRALAELLRARQLDQPARILIRWADDRTRALKEINTGGGLSRRGGGQTRRGGPHGGGAARHLGPPTFSEHTDLGGVNLAAAVIPSDMHSRHSSVRAPLACWAEGTAASSPSLLVVAAWDSAFTQGKASAV